MIRQLLAGAELKPGVAILLVVLFVLVAAAAMFFLYRGIRKDRNRYIADKLKIGELNKDSFDDLILRRFHSAGKNTHFSVFFIEINDAKNIRESFGEKQFAGAVNTLVERLYRILPKGSKVCLYEYDLLAVLVDEDLDKKALSDLASFCLLEGRKPVSLITRVRLELDLSIGVNSYNAFSANFNAFKQNLELALAVSKRNGLNKYTIYSSEISNSESEEYKYYQEIKSAIEANEFTLYYQPVYDLKNNVIFAYESLLRWNHKTLGVLAPGKFLNILEQSGDINWVGAWAFEQLLIAQQRYKQKNPDKNVTFSMNLSPKQLMNPNLTDDFRRVLKKYKVPANEVCMEIVEFAMFDKMPEVHENIQKLVQCGFQIALDDFGLEMSSLKRLENLQVNWVKLDRSFIDEAKDDLLIGGVANSLVGYAEKNDFRIIAEGIEDDVTLDFIKELSIPYGQGYYFGKPKAPAEYDI
ncbi:MAG: EAL domain-containing protein [Candidatus Borkfalkia sp.]